ncbi:MAG: hypothetical protein CVV07_08695 [Gammaproteobacteria bacterium HGW-Gammaproteobacteria-11]|nr:MAG: hypothetical protein CVV07_08695 [Gammaproteobacteria bacterium HGW-Gammaproteobacteria-11]
MPGQIQARLAGIQQSGCLKPLLTQGGLWAGIDDQLTATQADQLCTNRHTGITPGTQACLQLLGADAFFDDHGQVVYDAGDQVSREPSQAWQLLKAAVRGCLLEDQVVAHEGLVEQAKTTGGLMPAP